MPTTAIANTYDFMISVAYVSADNCKILAVAVARYLHSCKK